MKNREMNLGIKIKTKYKVLFLLISFMIVSLYSSYLFFSKESLYNHLKNDGVITQSFTKYFKLSDSKLYGTGTQLYCFITNKGDTVSWREKSAIDLNLTLDFYIPWQDSIIYNVKNPSEYMFVKYYKTYSDSYDKVIYFAVCIPLGTLFCYMLIVMILQLLKLKNIISSDFLFKNQ
jgi:hypothetical protein